MILATIYNYLNILALNVSVNATITYYIILTIHNALSQLLLN